MARSFPMFRIVDWDKLYENNRTREVKHLNWIPIPNKLDGDGYTELVDGKDGAALYGAWVALIIVASRCDPRGTLVRATNKPHDAASLSRITRLPEGVINKMLQKSQAIGWIELVDVAPSCEIVAPSCPLPNPNPNPNPNPISENKPASPLSAELLISLWNEAAKDKGLAQVQRITAKRRQQCNTRLKESGWLDAFCKCLDERLPLPDDGGGNWQPSIDKLIGNDSEVFLILEGKYDFRRDMGTPTNGRAKNADVLDFLDNLKKDDRR